MKHIAIITAKGGNLSIPNKNLLPLKDKSILRYVIEAAQASAYVQEIFVSTEDALIRKEALRAHVDIIDRPVDLATPTANHGDAIIHAALEAQKRMGHIDTITILLGNSALLLPSDIDRTITSLINNPGADSAMTVWQAQDDHPYRAMSITPDGYLNTFGEKTTDNTNRQSYPPVYFYDQGPWTVRMQVLLKTLEGERTGPACWWWMGKKCLPVLRPWVTGRDVHSMLDLAVAKAWLDEKMWELEA